MERQRLGEACGAKEILVWPALGGFRCWNTSLQSQLPLWGHSQYIYIYIYIYKNIYIHCIAINDIAVFVKLDSYGKYLMAIYCGLAVSSYAYILRTESVAV